MSPPQGQSKLSLYFSLYFPFHLPICYLHHLPKLLFAEYPLFHKLPGERFLLDYLGHKSSSKETICLESQLITLKSKRLCFNIYDIYVIYQKMHYFLTTTRHSAIMSWSACFFSVKPAII